MDAESEEPENEEGADEEAAVRNARRERLFGRRRRRKNEEGEEIALWLITFTDVVALMLTFFVLLYAMSIVKEDEWAEMTGAVNQEFGQFFSFSENSGTQDAIEIDKLDYAKALDLGYLESLIRDLIGKEEMLTDVTILKQRDRLIISMPSALLFDTASARISEEGKRALFSVGGALSRIRNGLEIVGNADPRLIESGETPFNSNWELSLARAMAVAGVLRDVGYSRDMTVKGLSSARYDELPYDMDEMRRLDLARRVDIVILKDTRAQRSFMDIK